METKNFIQIDVKHQGFKMINIHNIALIEIKDQMTKITLNILGVDNHPITYDVNEDYVKFTLRIAKIDSL